MLFLLNLEPGALYLRSDRMTCCGVKLLGDFGIRVGLMFGVVGMESRVTDHQSRRPAALGDDHIK